MTTHYYIDFPTNPPPFGELIPHGVGYISKTGLRVLYGQKTLGKLQSEGRFGSVEEMLMARGGPHPSVIAPKVLAKIMGMPKPYQQGGSAINGPNNQNKLHCAACGDVPKVITRHHIVPRSMKISGKGKCIRLCLPCHKEIHRFSNQHISELNATEQIALINHHRPRIPHGQPSHISPDQEEPIQHVATVPAYVKKQAAKIKLLQERSALGIRPKRTR